MLETGTAPKGVQESGSSYIVIHLEALMQLCPLLKPKINYQAVIQEFTSLKEFSEMTIIENIKSCRKGCQNLNLCLYMYVKEASIVEITVIQTMISTKNKILIASVTIIVIITVAYITIREMILH
ncbi:hypothetical protein PanWU01x14_155650 [Parasponia andersonii]|uniref:Uncharacterized protein n=1 Tax=Parasponia andersonii TaxID=3476 RepID=A0A2P5CG84_PARAD|nr:hypothetical protein PanWU01x14_155650 [Parasponia andersonii]